MIMMIHGVKKRNYGKLINKGFMNNLKTNKHFRDKILLSHHFKEVKMGFLNIISKYNHKYISNQIKHLMLEVIINQLYSNMKRDLII
jgi:hypothetical protein